MDKVLIDKDKVVNLGNKVRAKVGTQDLMTVDQMAAEIETLPSGTDGQFFPMNMTQYMIPTMTLTYNGEEI